MTDADSDAGEPQTAVVLDYLAHGRTDDGSPQYQRSPLAYALGTDEFDLFEIVFEEGAGVSIGDRIAVQPADARESIETLRKIEYDDLSGGAQSELEYVVEEVVEEDVDRFVNFYNEAQPITLRLHQLNLLPGIGKKLRNTILDERKRKPFESFDELEERVGGLHDPKGVIAERIIEEIREEDLKYRIFAQREQ